MNWSHIGKEIAKSAPLSAAILESSFGPAANAVGAILASALGVEATPSAVAQALENHADAHETVEQAEKAHQDKLAGLRISAASHQLAIETRRLQPSNQRREHWSQWLWRPLNGLLFAPTILAIYVILPLLHIHVPHVPVTVWEAWGALLGITAWHRGVRQRLDAGDGPSFGARLGEAISTMAERRHKD